MNGQNNPIMNNLHDILKASYEPNRDAEETLRKDGYTLDRNLSNRDAKVFLSESGEPNIVYRGTTNKKDIFSDVLLGLGLSHLDPRQRQSNNLVKAVKEKYKTDPNLYGHSLGGGIAEKAGKETGNTGQVITYNKAVSPSDIFQINPSNQTDVRTSGDIVSALSMFQRGGKKKEIKVNKGILRSHKLNQLKRL